MRSAQIIVLQDQKASARLLTSLQHLPFGGSKKTCKCLCANDMSHSRAVAQWIITGTVDGRTTPLMKRLLLLNSEVDKAFFALQN